MIEPSWFNIISFILLFICSVIFVNRKYIMSFFCKTIEDFKCLVVLMYGGMKKRNQQNFISTLFGIVLIIITSCNDSIDYEKYETESIENYLKIYSDLDFQLKPSGLYYFEAQTGSGAAPQQHDTAYIRYAGKFLNDKVFESNYQDDEPYSFPVGEGYNIAGVDEGITYMRAGGYSILLIPSKLAYGSEGTDKYWIPGYTPLIYEIELVGVVPGPGNK